MPRPIHFEIPADHPERAIEFYHNVFGWEFQKWEGPNRQWHGHRRRTAPQSLSRSGDSKHRGRPLVR